MTHGLEVFHSLKSSMQWNLNNEGFLCLEKNQKILACARFKEWGSLQFSEFAKALLTELNFSEAAGFKLIGPINFIQQFSQQAEARKWTILKTVVREGNFEVQVNPLLHKLQVSREVATPLNKKIKVMIVDDSATIRNILNKLLSADPAIEVVHLAEGPRGIDDAIKLHRPDVMTLDIHMPEMDGVTLLKNLLPKYSIPTIMISSISKEEGPQVLEALEAGAVDYIQKPTAKELNLVGPIIIERVKIAAQAKIQAKVTRKVVKRVARSSQPSDHIVLIGSSTGGTEALRVIFESLSEQIPPVLVVQHIPPVFSKSLADRLNSLCPFEVKEAEHDDLVLPNRVLIAPGGKQMGVRKVGSEMRIVITDDAPVNRHKPSVDYMFDSISKIRHPDLVGVILTGMGADGAKGLKKLRDQGARTIAQNKETCVVWGMPKEAEKINAAEFVLPIDEIASAILDLCSATPSLQKTS